VTTVISGSNNVTLSSATSTYSGGTVINAGSVTIGANTHLGAAAGGLTFNGTGGLTFSAATTLGTASTPANRAIALNNGALATITTGAFNSSLIGNISGTGGIILAGNSGNTLTIGQSTSTSTYSGPTVINVGTLKSGVANAFGSNSAVTIANTAGAVLDITGFNTALGSLSGGGTTGGTVTMTAVDFVWTAGAADWTATARYVSIYDDTAAAPTADPLIAYWDYGATFAVGNAETFTLDFGASVFTIV
jgi:fibronectin-binding autotransporter adhesin